MSRTGDAIPGWVDTCTRTTILTQYKESLSRIDRYREPHRLCRGFPDLDLLSRRHDAAKRTQSRPLFFFETGSARNRALISIVRTINVHYAGQGRKKTPLCL